MQPKFLKKLKQLDYTAVFNASYLFFMKHSRRRIFKLKCYLDNLLIDIIRSNYINFQEIMRRYEAINVKNLRLLMPYEKLASYDIHIKALI
jgi:hypothetical protein